jgi:hypothetical protein
LIELPELPPCPRHIEEKPKCIADCRICWTRFYLRMEYKPVLDRLNRRVQEFGEMVQCAAAVIAHEKEYQDEVFCDVCGLWYDVEDRCKLH